MNIPALMLPHATDSSRIYGFTHREALFDVEIPIAGIAGDQQAALIRTNLF
jgi:glycerol kinase